MTPETQASYRKLAANFYKTRLGGEAPTPKRIADSLKAAGSEYRPAYWRRLRNALAFDQQEKGFKDAATRINATKNPITREGSTEDVPAKQPRAKRIAIEDENKLLGHFEKSEDRESYAAVVVARFTGARPAEFASITVDGDTVTITGAKKSHDGTRGADRVIVLGKGKGEYIEAALQNLRGANLGAVQDRIRAAGKRLWPQRKAVPSLYSWRHQMGSELKAAGLDRKEVAYVMGHQSTESVERYGNAKTSRGGNVPRAADPKDCENVREKHSEPPSAKVATAPTALDNVKSGGLETSTKGLENMVFSREKAQNRQQVRGFGELKPGD